MASFADTAFSKDHAFASTAFDFGAAAGGGGAPGGVSGYLQDGRRKKKRKHWRDIVEGGSLTTSFATPQEASSRADSPINEDEIELLIIHALDHFYND